MREPTSGSAPERGACSLSVVVPVYNEQGNVESVHREISAVLDTVAQDAELLFVDDGSVDRTWQEILGACREDPRVRGIRLRRNFGKAAALRAGVEAARGRQICTMDGDGQDDPAEIPRMQEALAKGLDVVSGWKKPRRDPFTRVLSSWLFNLLVRRITGVRLHDHNCGMKCYRAEVFAEVQLYGELHRLVPVLAHARGFKVGEVVVNHRPRHSGHSKYGAGRAFKGLVDLLTVKFVTAYGSSPQHLLGILGLLFFALGLMGMGYLAATWVARLWDPTLFLPVGKRPLLIYSVSAFLFGAQMISFGFVAALITAQHSRDQLPFSVAEAVDGPQRQGAEPIDSIESVEPTPAPPGPGAAACD